jgi:two-component system chemotaxis sensor kinase CheA
VLFEPGFSTADGVNTLSGRGVGLAAVRSAALALGGSVGMTSQPGQGSELHIELPAHLL